MQNVIWAFTEMNFYLRIITLSLGAFGVGVLSKRWPAIAICPKSVALGENQNYASSD